MLLRAVFGWSNPTLLSLPQMEIAAIQTHGLTRRFGALTAVEDVTLSVAPGQFFRLSGAERRRQVYNDQNAYRSA
jgi:hypothetical protein